MATTAIGSLDYWRKFFRSTNSDIIEVIECAILVATSDCPKELRSRRDQITEKLYMCRVARCEDCDRAVQSSGVEEEEEDGDGDGGKKESEAGSSNSSGGGEELNRMVSNLSYNEAAALTEEIEEESQTVGEVLRIKELLTNHQDESDNVLFDSLRRLQLMDLSMETLKATDIGRAVNGLRKHNSKQIRHLVRTLIENWKVLVDQWVSAAAAIANNTPDSVSPTDMDEEEGLPSPPLDEGALWATQTTSIQLSEFFDGMDDEGNVRINDEFDEEQEDGSRYPDPESPEPWRKQQSPEDKGQMKRREPVVRQATPMEAPNGHAKPRGIDKGDMRRQEPTFKQTKLPSIDKDDTRRQEPVVRQTKPRDVPNEQTMPHSIGNKQNMHNTTESGPGRPPKLSLEKKNSSQMNAGLQKQSQFSSQDKQSRHVVSDSGPGRPLKLSSERRVSGEMNAGIQKKPPTSLEDKLKNSEDSSLRAKLEAAKRKLHENYQQAENAKKQRTIQVMELHDIPKRAHMNRPPVPKHKSNIRNLLNGRR